MKTKRVSRSSWAPAGVVLVALGTSSCESDDPAPQQRVLPNQPAPSEGSQGGVSLGVTGLSDAFSDAGPPDAAPGGGSDGEALCGDGIRAGTEECDDGNLVSEDGCSSRCFLEICGNGRVDPGETCDRVDPTCVNCLTSVPRVLPDAGAPHAGGPDAGPSNPGAPPPDPLSFELRNGSFSGSLEPWEGSGPVTTSVRLSTLDLADAPGSGSAQLSITGGVPASGAAPPGTSDGVLNTLIAQCVRTSPGSTYTLSARARALGAADGALELGAVFHAGPSCTGAVVGGVSTSYWINESWNWQPLTLPPPSPIPDFTATFSSPLGAGSLLVQIELVQEPDEHAPDVLIDAVALTRVATCGDGTLQTGEECDPPGPLCTASCRNRATAVFCGNGHTEAEEGEQCDPPSFEGNCGTDCRVPVCGDGQVGGREQCDPPGTADCDSECQLEPGDPDKGNARACVSCLGDQCGTGIPAESNLYAACYSLQGDAQAGAGRGRPLRQLCADAVECMRLTGCAADTLGGQARANPAACFCGKGVLVPTGTLTVGEEAALRARQVRECSDGRVPANGPCWHAFADAAEVELGADLSAAAVLAAMDPQLGQPALRAAVQLTTACAQPADRCQEECDAGAAACGNAVVEIGEACDPGDPEWGSLCQSPYCSILPCGNGVVDTTWPYTNPPRPSNWNPETCDVADPFTNQGGKCPINCQLKVVCGDGILTASVEACDEGPNGTWETCCKAPRPGETRPLNLDCDTNRDGDIDAEEECKIPARCGDGRRTGNEECDPPKDNAAEAALCDSTCHLIDACTTCSRNPEFSCATFENALDTADPALQAGGRAVLDCWRVNRCLQMTDCYCGDRDRPSCLQLLGGNGPCAQVINETTHNIEGVSCAELAGPTGENTSVMASCVSQYLADPKNGTGLATKLTECRIAYECAEPCGAL